MTSSVMIDLGAIGYVERAEEIAHTSAKNRLKLTAPDVISENHIA